MLKIVSIFLIILGSLIVYFAKVIVKKYEMDRNIKCEYESELCDQEITDYKLNLALIRIKIVGFVFFLPGIFLAFLVFK